MLPEDNNAELTLHALLAAQALRAPGAPAILGANHPVLTFEQLYSHCCKTVAALRLWGIGPSDQVAIALPNGVPMAVTLLGVAAASVAAPLSPSCRSTELNKYFAELNLKALITQSGTRTAAEAAALQRGIAVLELTSEMELTPVSSKLPDGKQQEGPQWPSAEDLALILPTSGTTSRPKLVGLTQANLCMSAANIRASLALSNSDCCLNIMPLFHVHGIVGALLSSLAAGGSIVCTPGFDGVLFGSWLDKFRPTWYTAVPTLHQAILACQISPKDSSFRIVRSSSAPLPKKLRRELEAFFNAPVIEAYGMTEATHQICSNPLPPGERKEGSVGLPRGPEVSIIDNHGRFLPRGAVGEIVIRGAAVIKGYLGAADRTSEHFESGWFKTGDQGYFDRDGYLFLTGRLKEIINCGGEKISPAEIDEALLDHPAVSEAISFALPHPTLGEAVGAAVVLRRGGTATEEDLRVYVAARLSDFKAPHRIVIVEAIPKGDTGKAVRTGMAARLAEDLQQGRVPPVTVLEKLVAQIYREVLGGMETDSSDNFFTLGGDSLRATQILSRIRAACHVTLPIATIFRKPSVRELATEILAAKRRQ